MKGCTALAAVAFVVLLALSGGCTKVEVVSEPTARPTSEQKDISKQEQDWIDGWIEDGSSVVEARCLWREMVKFYGSERVLMGAIVVDDHEDMLDDLFDEPSLIDCFEY